MSPIKAWNPQQQEIAVDLVMINRKLEGMNAEQRVEWSLHSLPGNHVMTSSFGIQGALMLHLVTRIQPDIPVVLVDTGYLFPETYSFIDQLTERLQLNLQVYRAPRTPAWQESRHGRLWEQGLDGIEHYNRINKVEPLQRALKQLEVGSWYAGLRRQQSQSRSTLPVVRIQDGRFKIHPVIDWHSQDVYRYLQKHNLPYHPLWEQGYASVGDVHTSRPLELGMHEEETRFFGLKRECGIHE
ncbi:MAG: phosphoadenosine phosphosulfate reductase [gamma proteobacterium symbiont of Ctena orbiculata]|nr:phosphoadenylyl-sulfate reductase [Candidatus Thiodiazotropha taylori]PUB87247.1 MAG: phosphoadenosine phosphosulfate reductase [gamma proteobacterium symbiont of Ctena orbiculata]MBT2995530.1 phosphoadenylyl-sulfate reductase [Candidatus Thiodiazotropha taylori]MBT2999516.1 phosphoadenylyl-sulfate reductase [Candidatus Thiodiazotropha taylori]MBV2106609.1 phosphoadenylyl-sulfate reductase [Candidatus Thiodiazotropha taylori]